MKERPHHDTDSQDDQGPCQYQGIGDRPADHGAEVAPGCVGEYLTGRKGRADHEHLLPEIPQIRRELCPRKKGHHPGLGVQGMNDQPFTKPESLSRIPSIRRLRSPGLDRKPCEIGRAYEFQRQQKSCLLGEKKTQSDAEKNIHPDFSDGQARDKSDARRQSETGPADHGKHVCRSRGSDHQQHKDKKAEKGLRHQKSDA